MQNIIKYKIYCNKQFAISCNKFKLLLREILLIKRDIPILNIGG